MNWHVNLTGDANIYFMVPIRVLQKRLAHLLPTNGIQHNCTHTLIEYPFKEGGAFSHCSGSVGRGTYIYYKLIRLTVRQRSLFCF